MVKERAGERKKTQHRKAENCGVRHRERLKRTDQDRGQAHYRRGVSLWEQSDRMPRLTPEEEAAADTSSTLPAGRM